MNRTRATIAALLATLAVLAATALAQVPPPGPAGPPPPPKPKVFLDWPGGDLDFLRAEIPFVEFVPELAAAQVRVLITPSGPPGGPVSLAFAGLGPFQGDDNVLSYAPEPGASPDDAKKGLAGTIKLGLLRYAAKTPVARDLTVKFLDQTKPTPDDQQPLLRRGLPVPVRVHLHQRHQSPLRFDRRGRPEHQHPLEGRRRP